MAIDTAALDAFVSLWPRLRRAHGARVDDVFALLLLRLKLAKPGPRAAKLLRDFSTRVARVEAPDSAQKLAKYFEQNPLPPRLMEAVVSELREWNLSSRTAKPLSAHARSRLGF
jgi:hypothetical protein